MATPTEPGLRYKQLKLLAYYGSIGVMVTATTRLARWCSFPIFFSFTQLNHVKSSVNPLKCTKPHLHASKTSNHPPLRLPNVLSIIPRYLPPYTPSPPPAIPAFSKSPKNRHRTLSFHPSAFHSFAVPPGNTSTTPSSPVSCVISTSTSSLASNTCSCDIVLAKASAS